MNITDEMARKMDEHSYTPRTDAVIEKILEEDDGIYTAAEDLLFHARKLETEIRQLEVAVYDLKTENNELRKDKERLDWILSDAGKYWLSSREDVDKEMADKTMQD